MKKKSFVLLMALAMNLGVYPVAAFSLFATPEGTGIWSADFLIAVLIMLAANIVVIQLLLAIRKNAQRLLTIGWILAFMQLLLFIFMYGGVLNLSVFLTMSVLVVAVAFILLVTTITAK
ncbi:MAG: hypothetical protein ABS882_00480 [Lysinibacillus sp.]